MTQPTPSRTKTLRSLFLGGLLPVIAFTWVESQFGIIWGLIVGMVFGVGEILWEWRSQGRVEAMTWGGNGLILVLGGISLLTQDGVWFKLQPSVIELVMAIGLWGTLFFKKPFLLSMAQKQGGMPADLEQRLHPQAFAALMKAFQGLTFRLGFFLVLHAALAAWAALYWSSTAWAFLKGIGFTVSFLVYMVVESLVLRYRISSNR
jgi:intracellular septation protein